MHRRVRTTTKFSSASVGSYYCQFIVVLCCENKSAFIVVLCCCQFIVVLCCCQFIVVLCCENYARRRSHAPQSESARNFGLKFHNFPPILIKQQSAQLARAFQQITTSLPLHGSQTFRHAIQGRAAAARRLRTRTVPVQGLPAPAFASQPSRAPFVVLFLRRQKRQPARIGIANSAPLKTHDAL